MEEAKKTISGPKETPSSLEQSEKVTSSDISLRSFEESKRLLDLQLVLEDSRENSSFGEAKYLRALLEEKELVIGNLRQKVEAYKQQLDSKANNCERSEADYKALEAQLEFYRKSSEYARQEMENLEKKRQCEVRLLKLKIEEIEYSLIYSENGKKSSTGGDCLVQSPVNKGSQTASNFDCPEKLKEELSHLRIKNSILENKEVDRVNLFHYDLEKYNEQLEKIHEILESRMEPNTQEVELRAIELKNLEKDTTIRDLEGKVELKLNNILTLESINQQLKKKIEEISQNFVEEQGNCHKLEMELNELRRKYNELRLDMNLVKDERNKLQETVR